MSSEPRADQSHDYRLSALPAGGLYPVGARRRRAPTEFSPLQ